MNKKFFTLIASAFMLAASLGTVNAQDAIPASKVTTGGLPTENQKFLYHLVGETNIGSTPRQYFLVIDNNGYLHLKTTAEYAAGEYAFGNSLWCVNISDQEDQGLNPTFVFENKGAGLKLGVSQSDVDVNAPDSIDIRFGALNRFEFSRTYKTVLEDAKPLKLYHNADSILTFVANATGEIEVRAYLATAAAVTQGSYADDVVLFTLYRPDEVILNATQFNTILNTEKDGWVTLNFDPAPTETSEFQTAIKAEDVTGPVPVDPLISANTNALAAGRWLKFYRNTTDASKKYLRVDTAYFGEHGTKFAKFAFGDGPSGATAQKFAIEKQYYFQARYYVLNDSLAIDVMQATFPKDNEIDAAAGRFWYNYPSKTHWNANDVYGGTFFNGHSSPETKEYSADSLHVKLQDLISGQTSLLTVGTIEVSTRIELGLKSCSSVAVNLTSKPSDLYTIKNNAGQYLVVLINTDTVLGTQRTAPRWMTLDEATQNPNRIPAFQWVVEQTRTDFPNSSPLRIANREFGHTTETGVNLDYHLDMPLVTVQLTTTGSTQLLYGETVFAANFIPVPPLEKGDKHLGYKYLPDDSLKFNTYDFNYLHELNAEKYLYIKNTADSSIYLNTATQSRTQFELIAQGTPKRYGYWTAAVPGDLAKLEKVSYVLRVKDGNALAKTGSVVAPDGEGRYAVSKASGVDTSVFLLKTNNTKDGRDYYALLDTGAYGVRYPLIATKVVKLGIDDANVWAYEQDLNEFRTSTFYIAPYNEPLYRRFDNAEYGRYAIKEPYGDASNSPLWLKFAKHNNWGTEFLFENSPRGNGSKDPAKPDENEYRDELSATGQATISFLGFYNKIDYPENGEKSNYTFYVDTAYVRNATPMPQYMLAVRPDTVRGDTIYRITKDSVWDANGQIYYHTSETIKVVRPSFTRGFYVFNAQDSIGHLDANNQDARNKDYVGKFAYGAQYTTRLAFVDGVHMGDTFYVLRNNPFTPDIDSAYLLAIPRADKHYLGQNTHYTPRWQRNGTPIWGNNNSYSNASNGKSMVFQFRLYDPDGTSDQNVDAKMVRKFMIESRQDDNTEIGPMEGRWIQYQNGIPVISERTNLVAAKQNGAEIFNVLAGDDKAVGNGLAPTVSTVKVIGETGAVTILNAGGKKVTISNILGQAVAGQVISSDNATIALPKGIVVVAVEGEAAVKAIVK